MKYVILFLLLVVSGVSNAGTISCGVVSIERVLAGPRHGAMMFVSNYNCGNKGGWICLDPMGENVSQEVSDRVYSLVLAFHLAGKPVQLTVYDSTYPSACGGYPALEDVRTAVQ